MLGWVDLISSVAFAAEGAVGRRCVENCGPHPAMFFGAAVGLIVTIRLLRKGAKEAGSGTGGLGSLQAFQNWAWALPGSNGFEELIELHLSFTGKETIRLNGGVITSRWKWTMKSQHRIRLSDGREAVLDIATSWAQRGMPDCTLTVDGVEVPPSRGGVVTAGAGSASVEGAAGSAGKKKRSTLMTVFGVLFLLMPVATLGGALPVLIALGGLGVCSKVDKAAKIEMPAKVAICSVVYLVCWVVLLMVLAALGQIDLMAGA